MKMKNMIALNQRFINFRVEVKEAKKFRITTHDRMCFVYLHSVFKTLHTNFPSGMLSAGIKPTGMIIHNIYQNVAANTVLIHVKHCPPEDTYFRSFSILTRCDTRRKIRFLDISSLHLVTKLFICNINSDTDL